MIVIKWLYIDFRVGIKKRKKEFKPNLSLVRSNTKDIEARLNNLEEKEKNDDSGDEEEVEKKAADSDDDKKVISLSH